MKRTRIPRSKIRPKPEQVFGDVRTKRKRTRGDALRAELRQAAEEIDGALRNES